MPSNTNTAIAESPRLKVLFVCAANQQRSPTAERIYRNDPRLEVRSAGVRLGANRRISENDLRWADVVFVMEREHKDAIMTRFGGIPHFPFPRIEILDILDEFDRMDAELIKILKAAIDPELDHLLAKRINWEGRSPDRPTRRNAPRLR